ncbi:MAG: hypothetical protein IJ131_05935 [Eggerthellaceae bacterium]|nr:hypothetical protein [Eggerthellaceae bacterium]
MKKARLFLLLLLVYLLIAIPFKVMEVIPGFTDVRPVTLLGPVYAVFYGLPGCVVMAVGNLIMDTISGSLRWSSIGGFVANFAGPFLIYLYWTKWSRVPFSLRDAKSLLTHVGIVCAAAALETLLITPMVAVAYPDVDAVLFGVSVMLNTSVFPIVFGIPLLILMHEEFGAIPHP